VPPIVFFVLWLMNQFYLLQSLLFEVLYRCFFNLCRFSEKKGIFKKIFTKESETIKTSQQKIHKPGEKNNEKRNRLKHVVIEKLLVKFVWY
jgi:hypothetical protein